MSEKQIKTYLIRQAVRELEYAQKKYDTLKELDGVIDKKKLEKVKSTL